MTTNIENAVATIDELLDVMDDGVIRPSSFFAIDGDEFRGESDFRDLINGVVARFGGEVISIIDDTGTEGDYAIIYLRDIYFLIDYVWMGGMHVYSFTVQTFYTIQDAEKFIDPQFDREDVIELEIGLRAEPNGPTEDI